MFIKQSLAVLALFLASSSDSAVTAVKSKAEEEYPVFVLANRDSGSDDSMPSRHRNRFQALEEVDNGDESDDRDEPEAVPIVLALNRHSHHRSNKRSRRSRQRRSQQQIFDSLGMRPSDYFSSSSPGVILLKDFVEKDNKPQVRFQSHPNVFMIAEKQPEEIPVVVPQMVEKEEEQTKPHVRFIANPNIKIGEVAHEGDQEPKVRFSEPLSNFMGAQNTLNFVEKTAKPQVRLIANPNIFIGQAPAEQKETEAEAPKPPNMDESKKDETPKEEPKKEKDIFDKNFHTDFSKQMSDMEKRMESRMHDIQKRFQESLDHDLSHLEKKEPVAENKPAEAATKAKSNLTNMEQPKSDNKEQEKPQEKKSVTTEREFKSDEFADAETTTEYDQKTGNYNVEKCVNGKCEKFTQYKNGTMVAQTQQTQNVTVAQAENKVVAPNNANQNQNLTQQKTQAKSKDGDDAKKDEKKDDKKVEKTEEEKKKEEEEKKKKETEAKLKELEELKAKEAAKKKAIEDKERLEKKQKHIKEINDEKADTDQRVKSASEKKNFWKSKAAAIKNATEMEKEEAAQDEKDYEEMRKAVPGVAQQVVKYTKKKMDADQEAQNARISKWERRVLRTHPAHRATEPEKEEDAEKDTKHEKSDAAVEEMKAAKKAAQTKEEVDPRIQLTAQISKPQQKSFTDKVGDEHVHFAQQESAPASVQVPVAQNSNSTITITNTTPVPIAITNVNAVAQIASSNDQREATAPQSQPIVVEIDLSQAKN